MRAGAVLVPALALLAACQASPPPIPPGVFSDVCWSEEDQQDGAEVRLTYVNGQPKVGFTLCEGSCGAWETSDVKVTEGKLTFSGAESLIEADRPRTDLHRFTATLVGDEMTLRNEETRSSAIPGAARGMRRQPGISPAPSETGPAMVGTCKPTP